eukprot:6050238-Pyramimonas_sp.AAC.1
MVRSDEILEVYSWGSGVNYTLGTSSTGVQPFPVCVESLRGQPVTHVSAAKFHSAAISATGGLYTWVSERPTR